MDFSFPKRMCFSDGQLDPHLDGLAIFQEWPVAGPLARVKGQQHRLLGCVES